MATVLMQFCFDGDYLFSADYGHVGQLVNSSKTIVAGQGPLDLAEDGDNHPLRPRLY